MSETLKDLRALPDEELIRRHDEHAQSTVVGTAHYLRELERRDQDRQTQAMVNLTRWITLMTLIILIATIVNVALVVLPYLG
ncbi:MAG: hypothetical protein QOH93_656 [Chloroflexia bacterium]|jgi:hypothetical protein|nr:hypothetical protein [Chloroflexia bacterium]